MMLRLSTLRARLLLIVGLALAPTLALSLYNYTDQRRQAVEATQRELLRLARLASERYARVVDAGRQLLMAVAEVPGVRARDAACDPLLSNLRQQHPGYFMLAVHEPGGEYVCGSLALATRLNVADRPYFQRALATRGFSVGEYQIGRATGKPSLVLAQPIVGADGTVIGVVSAVLDLAWLNDLASTVELPSGTLLMVLDRNGTVLVRSPAVEGVLGRPAPEQPIVEAMRTAGDGLARASGPDGIPRLFAFTTLGGPASDLHLSIGTPESAVLAGPNRALATSLASLGLASVAVLTIAWTFGSLLVLRPTRALLQATRRLADGDLEARSALPRGQGELSELAQAFDEMAAALSRAFVEADRRRAEAEASEARYRTLFEGVPVGLYRSTPAGELLDVNPAFARMLGYAEPAELRALPAAVLWATPEDRLEWRQLLEKEGLIYGLERRLRRRDGGVIWVRSSSRAVRDAAGSVSCYEGVAEDVTAVKELQDSLRRSETLTAMGTLVAGVAHEVRNPLFGISANLDAFQARFGGRPEFAETIRLLRNETDRLTTLMHDLLEYGKPVRLQPGPGALQGVLQQAVEFCAGLATRKQVTVVSTVEEPLPPVVMDPERLVRAFQNLVDNAVHHSPPGCPVEVEAHEERSEDTPWVRCTVRDSGPGIPPEDLGRIFEPFYSRRRGGTGLGLSIVQRVVEEHGGRVWAENRPQGGAELIVRLPSLSRAPARAG